MRYSIKRRNKFIKKAILRPALLLVSAIALFSNIIYAAPEAAVKNSDQPQDSLFTARHVFEEIHIPALEILPVTTRLDMLDYWDVDSVYKASNIMEGLSWLENVSPDFLKVHITAVSTLELKILPVKKGKIIMAISTVGDDVQAQDSEIKFYDENFRELPATKYLVMPHIKDFFYIPKGSATKMKEIENMIPFPTIAFTANPENNNLEARLTVEQYINQDDWNIAKLFVKPSITLEWHKDKYKFIK